MVKHCGYPVYDPFHTWENRHCVPLEKQCCLWILQTSVACFPVWRIVILKMTISQKSCRREAKHKNALLSTGSIKIQCTVLDQIALTEWNCMPLLSHSNPSSYGVMAADFHVLIWISALLITPFQTHFQCYFIVEFCKLFLYISF